MDEKNYVFYALTCIKDKHTSKCQMTFFYAYEKYLLLYQDKYTPKSILRFFLVCAHVYATCILSDNHTSNNHFGKNHHQKIEKTVAKIENAQKWAKIKLKNLG